MNMHQKPGLYKRSSWDRLKRIITDGRKLTKNTADDCQEKKFKMLNDVEHMDRLSVRNSWHLDYESYKKLSHKIISQKESSCGTLRKPLSGVVSRRSPRINMSKCRLENLLQLAIHESNEVNMTKLLTNNKIDINFQHEPGFTALHQACAIGNTNIIKILIEHGADITKKTRCGLSALQIATFFGHFDAAQFLIGNGACSKDVEDGFSADKKLVSTIILQFS